MTDEELLKFDLEELELEKEVLEELLHNYSSPQYNYWLEELERVRKALEGLFLRSRS